MKKLFTTFALAIALVALPVMAQADLIQPWTLDVNGFSYNLNNLGTSGSGSIYQDLGGNGVLDVGDQFTATSTLFNVTYNDGSGALPTFWGLDGTGNPLELFFYSDSLAGQVSSLTTGGGFTYEYTSGDVSLYLGDSTNIGGSKLLAEFDLESGSGEAADANLQGNFLNGETDFELLFLHNPIVDGWLDNTVSGGISFNPALFPGYPWMNLYFVLDLTNEDQGGFTPIFDLNNELIAFTADIENTAGPLTLVATPEPSTFLILGLGLLGLVGFRKKFTA